MAREKLKDFLTRRGSIENSISYIKKDDIVDGLGVDPGTGDALLDLINENKGLLGDYISFLTSEEKNEYRIKPGNSQANTSKRGDALDIADNQGAEKVFVEQGTHLKSKLNEYSNSGQFDASGTPLSSIIDKTGTNFSNHETLKNIEGRPLDKHGNTLVSPTGENNDVIKATNNLFLKNNRFANVGNPENKSFTEKPQLVDDFESGDKTHNKGTLILQNKFGEYDKDEEVVSINQLKEIGKSLLLNASGFANEDLESNSLVSDTTGFNKVENADVRSRNAKGFPHKNDISVREGRGDVIENDPDANNSKTFGSTYNTEFHFQGKNQRIAELEAMASMMALKTIAKDFFSTFIDMLRIQDRSTLQVDAETAISANESIDIGQYMLGRSRHMTSVKLDHKIFSRILTNTKYPYSAAVDRGIEVIFSESKPDKADNIVQSPGFWLAVSRSILKSFDTIISKYTDIEMGIEDENQLFLIYQDIVDTNKFIQFYNAMAIIGDISLAATDGKLSAIPKPGKSTSTTNFRDVDNLPEIGAYTPGKSRKNDGGLMWNQDMSPSTYILPANIIRAAVQLNSVFDGVNPARGLLGSKLVENTYFGVDVDGTGNRIPNEVVKTIEDKLDAEYVPFYIQDLRTNEIISFNAFLDSLTDNIQSNHTAVDGYGRLDPVQIYSSTSRTVSVGFTLLATNRQDFDSMWYKINKLTTLLYPQWTPGSMVGTDGVSKFYQPFSQVIGASPIVRLRVGDIIKSNYSRFALARTFGIGDNGVNANPSEAGEGQFLGNIRDSVENFTDTFGNILQEAAIKIWLTVFGSPISPANAIANAIPNGNTNFKKISKNLGRDVVIKSLSNFLINGYANPLAVNDVINKLKDPENFPGQESEVGYNVNRVSDYLEEDSLGLNGIADNINIDLNNLTLMILNPNTNNGYYSSDTKKTHYIPRRINVRVVSGGRKLQDAKTRTNRYVYKVKVVDINAPDDLLGKHLYVIHDDIYPDPADLFTTGIMGLTLYATDPLGSIGDAIVGQFDDTAIAMGIAPEAIDILRLLYSSNSKKFMEPGINPFTKAYETTAGRGLAGVIDGIQFNWLENFPWETDFNARAPMGCKISFSLKVIHDIPPGLDHSGFNKAPLYNVGEIMRNVSGDVYSDNGKTAEFNFKNQAKYRNDLEKNIKNTRFK